MNPPRWLIAFLLACLVILTLGTATAKALAADRAPLPVEQALAICRAVYFSNDPSKALALWRSLPPDEQASVAVLCLAYRQGARDMLGAVDAANQPTPQKD